jgi:hypothetical protein
MISNKFDRVSFWALFLVIVLSPIFFLPFTNIPIETSKGLLLVIGLAVAIIFWSLARFSDGKIHLPKSTFLLAGLGVVLAFFLSAAFSKASEASFFGTMLDVGTFWFIFAAFLLMFYASMVFKDAKNAKILLLGTILSSAVLLIFQTLRLFFSAAYVQKFLSLGILADKTGNILGSWNALGIFAGFAGLIFLLVAEFFPITKLERWILRFLTILAIIMIAAVDFPLVWILLGVSALIIFVYKMSLRLNENKEAGEQVAHFPAFSFFVIIVALFFFISGPVIQGYLPNRLGISNTEVSPSFLTTMSVAKYALAKSPILGAGPNRFGEVWAMYKPSIINATQFWDVSFNSGSGLLPSFVATTGILGILAWLFFLVLFVSSGLKSIFSSVKHGANWETMAFFVLSLYLFVASFFYSTGVVLFLLALAFCGVFLGLSSSQNPNGEISLSFLNDHRKSFFSILLLVVVIVFSVSAAFKYTERLASVSYFGKALNASTLPAAESAINKAISLYSNDLYLRTYAQIYLIKLDSIAKNGGSSLSDQDKADLQDSFNQAVSGAQSAMLYDPQNYLNYQALGSVYQSVGVLGVKDAYSKAIDAYNSASLLNPLNPGLKLDVATAALANGETDQAKSYAAGALQLKPDYTDALVFLSQMAKNAGDNAGALSYGQQALSFDPANQNLIQYVNSLNNPAPATTATVSNTKNTPAKTKK